MPEQIKKALLEAGRLILLGIVSWLGTDFVILKIVGFLGLHLPPEIVIQVKLAFLVVLKAVDKWLHELGKQYENTDNSKYNLFISGLTRF